MNNYSHRGGNSYAMHGNAYTFAYISLSRISNSHFIVFSRLVPSTLVASVLGGCQRKCIQARPCRSYLRGHNYKRNSKVYVCWHTALFSRLAVLKIISLFVRLGIGGIVVETIGARLQRDSGGQKISIELAPYFVSLRRNRRHVGGDTLISDQRVLTAADYVFDGSLGLLHGTIVVRGTNAIDETYVGPSIKKHLSTRRLSSGKILMRHSCFVISSTS